ncbi:MAG TPA: hypothetical protein VLG49_00335 [Rhabdochlamydiaceae bacterium]|nr:hypothetical protein [Rhabdochlamydiaceae bacterium]
MRFLFVVFCVVCSCSYASAISEKVVICGICRDVESRLPHTIAIMEKIGALFQDYRIVVYENNSIDGTKNQLRRWRQRNSRVLVQSEDINRGDLAKSIINVKNDGHFYRPEEIARARNIVLDRAMSEEFQDFPYIIWMDMDFKIPPALRGIVEVFQSGREWDAVFAYGIDPRNTYWDWYAFRDAVYPLGSEFLGNDWWYMKKQFSLSQSDDWYPVYSAFGGCGIYKKSSIEGCRYSAIVTNDLETWMKQMQEQGFHHHQILMYQESLKKLHRTVYIPSPVSNLPRIEDPNVGIILNEAPDAVVWRMSSFVYQYPSVCEHVPFHASMIVRGHGKLYINPRLVFTYGG